MRPRLLDLFCGAGGAAMGYSRAGFEVVGVDINPQPHYPFEFHRADALTFPLDGFDVVHASPPCQAYSAMRHPVGNEAPALIEPTREALRATGLPYVIENVERAPLLDALRLCGTMFDLRVRRHRLFEIQPPVFALLSPCSCRHGVIKGTLIGHRVAGKVLPGRTQPPPATESDRREAIGVPWMTTTEARQAIPPAYTEWIGRQLMATVERAA